MFFWITLSHEVSRHFPHTSTYANFENLLHNRRTPANYPFNGQLETLLPNPTPHQHHRKQQQKLHHLKPLQQPIPPQKTVLLPVPEVTSKQKGSTSNKARNRGSSDARCVTKFVTASMNSVCTTSKAITYCTAMCAQVF